MIADWKKEIAVAWYVQNEIDKLDTQKIWRYYLPKVAATEQDLVEAETALGHPLDARYREFLKFANGWRCFFQYVDIFGTEELIGGTMMHRAHILFNEIVPALSTSGVAMSDLLPIAVSSNDKDLFVIVKPGGPQPGTIVWFAGYEIERFPTFDDYFLAMVDYNRLRYEKFQKGEIPIHKGNHSSR